MAKRLIEIKCSGAVTAKLEELVPLPGASSRNSMPIDTAN